MAMMPPAFRPPCLGPKRERVAEADARRGSAYSRGYDRQHGRDRAEFLRANPLCCCCKANGVIKAATVLDHIEPHKGDRRLFRDPTNWQALCAACHGTIKARLERLFLAGRLVVEQLRLARPMPEFFDRSGIDV